MTEIYPAGTLFPVAKSSDEFEFEKELGLIDLSPEELALRRQSQIALVERRQRQRAFLDALRQCGTVKEACEATGVSRDTVSRWKKDDKEFVVAYDDANDDFTESLEKVAFERAKDKSDLLLMFTLKKREPAYRDNFKMEHTGEVSIKLVRYDEPAKPAAPALPVEASKPVIEAKVVEPKDVPFPEDQTDA